MVSLHTIYVRFKSSTVFVKEVPEDDEDGRLSENLVPKMCIHTYLPINAIMSVMPILIGAVLLSPQVFIN